MTKYHYDQPSTALPTVKVEARYAPPAQKKLAPRYNPTARRALVLDALLSARTTYVPAEVAEAIGEGPWVKPGIKNMADALGMSTGSVQKALLWLREHGYIEGYNVKHLGPPEAHLRVIDAMKAWAFLEGASKAVKKLLSNKRV